MSLLSPLNEQHKALGATFTDFSGWQMPLHYGSILKEHLYVRESVGLFDISHMGAVFISGRDSAAWLNGLLANDLDSLAIEQAHYSFLLNDQGGVIDDLIVYRLAEDVFFVVPNASGVGAVTEHMIACIGEADVRLENRSGSVVSIAIQGKLSESLMQSMFPQIDFSGLEKNDLKLVDGKRDSMVIARTGYTGSDGFEIFTDIEEGRALWDRLLNNDSGVECHVCGLGSRDTLRIEAGYPLYGNELNSSLTPVQAGLGFFVGSELKASLKEQNPKNLPKVVYFKVLEKAPPPRNGYEIFEGESSIGKVTSGCLSPLTNEGIGFALVNSKISLNESEKYSIFIRNRKYSLMFVKRGII
jgi:aminomethyltransferase